MADEEPPKITAEWIENEGLRKKGHLDKIQFLDFRCYLNSASKFYLEAECTFDILNERVVLIAWATQQRQEDSINYLYYLRLSDGSLVKSKLNTHYIFKIDKDDIGDKESIVIVTISVETDEGIKTRIIVEKCKNVRP